MRDYWAGYLYIETRLKGQERLGHEVVLTFIKDHYDGLPKRVDAKLVRMGSRKSWAPRNSPPSTVSSPRLGASASSRAYPNPLAHPKVKVYREELKRRALGEGKRPEAKQPITLEVLEAVLATCDLDCMKGRRDHALLLVAWASGRTTTL